MYEVEIGDETRPAPSSSEPFHDRVDAMSDAELDELPFGVICIDREGRVLRYNAAEARLARLDRARVLGRHFFTQVAPCTATPEFRGRIERFFDGARGAEVQRFTYLFDFKFGAQLVTVELAAPHAAGRVYLFINRGTHMPPRPDAEAPAPSARELDGDAARGVLRDARSARYVALEAPALQSLAAAAQAAGADPRKLLDGWGVRRGRVASLDLETLALEQHQRALSDLTVEQAMAALEALFASQGWGSLEVDFAPTARSGAFVVRVKRAFVIEATRGTARVRTAFVEGFLRASLSHVAARRLHAHPVTALAADLDAGNASFVVCSIDRAPLLEQAAPDSEAAALTLLTRTLSELS